MSKRNVLTESKKRRALVALQARRLDEANTLYTQVCATDRLDADAWFMWGAVTGLLGLHHEAIERLQRSATLRPQHAQTYYNLGIALRSVGRWDEAVVSFREAVRLQPRHAEAHDCLAHALISLNRLDEAITALEESLRLRPDNAEMRSNLGSVYQARGELAKAEACYREAMRQKPGLAIGFDNLGSVLGAQGRHGEAIAVYREGLDRNPDDARAHSNLLLTLNYLDLDPSEVVKEHVAWAERHDRPREREQHVPNAAEPDRRLRIGYVSPDFREHSVAYFIEPVLESHDRSHFEIYCYSDVPRPDTTTERLRRLVDSWHQTAGWTDQRVIAQIMADRIDILVDLAGHTAGNRMGIFARKPAPLQASYLGYPNTTGLSAVDYRITDAVADPPGQEAFYTERLLRLPGCFLCYRPPQDAPEVGPLPLDTNGYVTFGSFNNLAKLQPRVIDTWAGLVESVPRSRLLIKNPSLRDPDTRRRLAEAFQSRGIDNSRVEFLGSTPTTREHLAVYNRVDVALDTFPYNGTTTTCEALWMGAPVIALAGRSHAGRVAATLLTAVGLQELVASSVEQYLERAATLAANLGALSTLRANLRDRLRASSLCNGAMFTQGLESGLRDIWRSWCKQELDGSK